MYERASEETDSETNVCEHPPSGGVTSCVTSLDPKSVREKEPARARVRLFALRVRVQSVREREGLHGRGYDCSLSACVCSRCAVRE